MRLFVSILSLSVWIGNAIAQSSIGNADSLAGRLVRQLYLYPQEKLYIHTDKPYYIGKHR